MDVRLELHRNSNAFSLLTLTDNQEYKIDIIGMTWFVRKVDILKSFALALETHISKQPAKYPIRRVMVKTLHVDGGRRDTPNNTLFTGQVPRRLIIGCVDKDAFFGHLRKNPFNFKNFGIKQIQVTAGDITYPRNPVVFDFPNKRYTRAFLGLFDAMNSANEDRGNSISYSDFYSGYTLFGFDLSPDCSDGAHWELIREGSTSIRIEFGEDTPQTGIKVVVFAEFDNLMTVDKNRNVFFDYTV
ncbi:MAG: hypothetical protein GY820_05790 [Gammaproteobacteria bacterium]|nr:hypothetical protein [Gammaproteobacteria bacterium]